MVILHIETSASTCSVAISDMENCIYHCSDKNGRNHAALLSLFIEEGMELLRKTGRKPDAVAVSSGPGSYTGLRIGVSTAKGICYALDIPLISISTLAVIALRNANDIEPGALIVPMIDARRMEVYDAIFDSSMNELRAPQAEILTADSFSTELSNNLIYFCGDGSIKFNELTGHPNARFASTDAPDAIHMIPLAIGKFRAGQVEDVAYFEPHYVKEFFTTFTKQ
jgi:tRNA threonylcarbamoyladenosine biosynthesis protein TsaB